MADSEPSLEANRPKLKDFVASIAAVRGDLSNISAPPFVLDTKSAVELPSYWAERPSVFVAPAAASDPATRALLVLKWFLSSLRNQQYAGRPEGSGIKKPLNAFLGELFLARWEDEAGLTRMVGEQVNHHPPVTACRVWNDEHGVSAEGYSRQEITFSGSINIQQIGLATFRIARHNETYLIPQPNIKIKGILSGSIYPELQGSHHIPSTNGYTSAIDFSGTGMFSAHKKHSFEARVYRDGEEDRPLYTVSGHWDGQFTIRDCIKEVDIETFDVNTAKITPMVTDSNDDQDPWESRRAWRGVREGLQSGNMQGVVDAKNVLENGQREMRKTDEDGKTWARLFYESSPQPDTIVETLAKRVGLSINPKDTLGVWRFKQQEWDRGVFKKPFHGGLNPDNTRVGGGDGRTNTGNGREHANGVTPSRTAGVIGTTAAIASTPTPPSPPRQDTSNSPTMATRNSRSTYSIYSQDTPNPTTMDSHSFSSRDTSNPQTTTTSRSFYPQDTPNPPMTTNSRSSYSQDTANPQTTTTSRSFYSQGTSNPQTTTMDSHSFYSQDTSNAPTTTTSRSFHSQDTSNPQTTMPNSFSLYSQVTMPSPAQGQSHTQPVQEEAPLPAQYQPYQPISTTSTASETQREPSQPIWTTSTSTARDTQTQPSQPISTTTTSPARETTSSLSQSQSPPRYPFNELSPRESNLIFGQDSGTNLGSGAGHGSGTDFSTGDSSGITSAMAAASALATSPTSLVNKIADKFSRDSPVESAQPRRSFNPNDNALTSGNGNANVSGNASAGGYANAGGSSSAGGYTSPFGNANDDDIGNANSNDNGYGNITSTTAGQGQGQGYGHAQAQGLTQGQTQGHGQGQGQGQDQEQTQHSMRQLSLHDKQDKAAIENYLRDQYSSRKGK